MHDNMLVRDPLCIIIVISCSPFLLTRLSIYTLMFLFYVAKCSSVFASCSHLNLLFLCFVIPVINVVLFSHFFILCIIPVYCRLLIA